jgi:putative SOS response-associated peptidase YedK
MGRMCGRFTRDFTWQQVREFSRMLDLVVPAQEPEAVFNIAPTDPGPVIVASGDGGEVRTMRWGLLPAWAKDTKLAFSTINARLESVADKPAFRDAWKSRRALIPATGYYEWPVVDGQKRPHYIHLDGSPVMLFGGVWESRSDGAGGRLLTYSIVTREADPVIAPVHDRMPLILSPDTLHDWLHGSAEDAMEIAHAAPEPALRYHEVDKAVGNVRNQGAHLIAPIAGHAPGPATPLF